MQPAAQPVDPTALYVEFVPGGRPHAMLCPAPGHVVIVPPHGEQRVDGLFEDGVQHRTDITDRENRPSSRIITVTNSVDRCAWCSAAIPARGGPGRPRRFCKRSHRQRHYEARRLAAAQGIAADEVLIARDQFDRWRDELVLLESAIEDAIQDLGETPGMREYTEAFQTLYGAAGRTARFTIEPRALGAE